MPKLDDEVGRLISATSGEGVVVGRGARRRNELQTFSQRWAAAAESSSLDPEPGLIARAALDRGAELHAAARPDADDARDLVDQIARGELSPKAAAVSSLSASSTVEEAKRLSDLAIDRIFGEALATLRQLGDGLISGYLLPAHDSLVAEAVKLAPLVGAAESDTDALNEGAKAASAWKRLSEIAEAIRALRRCVGQPVIEQPDAQRVYKDFRFANNPLVAPERLLRRRHPARRLVDSLPTQPTINTADRVAELSQEFDARRRESVSA